MSTRKSTIQKFTLAGIALLAATASVTTPTAQAAASEQLTWLRPNSCTRIERSIGYVDADRECIPDHPAFGEDVTTCVTHFCAAEPGEPGAHIIHPSDFGPTT